MILRRVRIRDEQARQGEVRELGEARRAAAGDGEIGGAVGPSIVMKGGDEGGDAGLRDSLAHLGFVLRRR